MGFTGFLIAITIVCFLLILAVMVQNPKGGGLSSSFGGSQQLGGVQKTTDVLKDGVVISSTYWRTTLVPNDPQASTVLDEAYYLNIATYAWTQTSPQPYVPPTPPEA